MACRAQLSCASRSDCFCRAVELCSCRGYVSALAFEPEYASERLGFLAAPVYL